MKKYALIGFEIILSIVLIVVIVILIINIKDNNSYEDGRWVLEKMLKD